LTGFASSKSRLVCSTTNRESCVSPKRLKGRIENHICSSQIPPREGSSRPCRHCEPSCGSFGGYKPSASPPCLSPSATLEDATAPAPALASTDGSYGKGSVK